MRIDTAVHPSLNRPKLISVRTFRAMMSASVFCAPSASPIPHQSFTIFDASSHSETDLSSPPNKQAISHATRLQTPELTLEPLAMRAGRSFGRGRRKKQCFFLLGLLLVGRVGSLSEF